MAARKLSDDEITQYLATLEGWDLVQGKLSRDWTFPDFSAAFGFMTRIALIAEQLGHHPEWSNVYNRLSIALTTHDVDGISDLDFAFARKVNALG